MTDDTERVVAEIDAKLKERLKSDPRTIREIVEASLRSEFATAPTAAIERRIEEREERIQTLEHEINEREREIADERQRLERLESLLEDHDGRDQQLEAARDALSDTPREPDNPAIQRWADRVGITPTELIDRL